jgi:hypothetical protein
VRPLAAAILVAVLGCAGPSAPPPPAPPSVLSAEDPASPVHPRRFGSPGGIGQTRGWYVWHSFDPETGRAEVSHEQTGQRFATRVLPWATSYRHLAYPGHPDELLPGERVNLFFNPEGDEPRAYLVHFQDELGQMKGHGHFWRVEDVVSGGRAFTARGMSAEKPLDPGSVEFALDDACVAWRGRRRGAEPALRAGDRLYLTWCYEGTRRVVKVLSDGESLDALRAEAVQRERDRVAREGMAGFVEGEWAGSATLLVFSTYWSQAGELRPGQTVSLKPPGEAGVEARIVSRSNLGAYGSGPTALVVEGAPPGLLTPWIGGRVIRLIPR